MTKDSYATRAWLIPGRFQLRLMIPYGVYMVSRKILEATTGAQCSNFLLQKIPRDPLYTPSVRIDNTLHLILNSSGVSLRLNAVPICSRYSAATLECHITGTLYGHSL